MMSKENDVSELAHEILQELLFPCEKGVPIYPARFTVKKEEQKSIKNSTHAFPKLDNASYTLRALRKGYLYMYYKKKGKNVLKVWNVLSNGMFQQMVVKGSIDDATFLASASYGLDSKLKMYLNDTPTPFVIAPKESQEVYVGFSDTLWTSNISKMIIDTGSFRNKLMTKIDVEGWKESHDNTFKIEDIDTLVEEYRDKDWKNIFSWTKGRNTQELLTKSSLIAEMLKVPTSDKKMIGAMLYDNIGLVQDITFLIKEAHTKRDNFMKNEDTLHKKFVADSIELAYRFEVSSNFKKFLKKEKDEVILDRKLDTTLTGIAHWLPSFSIEENKEVYGDLDVNSEDFIKAIYKKHASDKVKLINEEARLFFLDYYKKESEKLNIKIIKIKNDRNKHLDHFLEPTASCHLGTSFLNYDRSYDMESETCTQGDESAIVSTYQFSQSFVSCIERMMNEVSEIVDSETGETIKNEEKNSFAKFMDNPKFFAYIMDIFEWSRKNKVDTLASVFVANDLSAWSRYKQFEGNNKANIEVQKEYKQTQQDIETSKKEIEKTKKEIEVLKKEQLENQSSRIDERSRARIIRLEKERIQQDKKLTLRKLKLKEMRKKSFSSSRFKGYAELQKLSKQLNDFSQREMGTTLLEFIIDAENYKSVSTQSRLKNKIAEISTIKDGDNINFTQLKTEISSLKDGTSGYKEVKFRDIELNKKLYTQLISGNYNISIENNIYTPKNERVGEEKPKKYIISAALDESEYEDIKQKIKILELNREEAERIFNEKQSKDFKKNQEKIDKINREREILKGKYEEKELKIINSADEEKKKDLRKHLKGLREEMEKLNQDTEELVKKKNHEFDVYLKEKQKELDSSLKKWVGGYEKTSSGLMFLFTGLNLAYALDSFFTHKSNKDDIINSINLFAAVMGLATAALQIYENQHPEKYVLEVNSTAMATMSKFRIIRTVFVSKSSIAGIIAGLADTFTAWTKGFFQLEENNSKAAFAYGIAGACLLGGVASGLSIGAAAVIGGIGLVVGVIIVSIAITVVGVIKYMEADGLAWDSMDKWLSGCFFGITEELKRLKKDDDKYEDKTFAKGDDVVIFHNYKKPLITNRDYKEAILDNAQQQKEIEAFLRAYTEPKFELDWDGLVINAATDTWYLAHGEHYPNKFEYKGEDGKMHKRATDNYGYSLEVKLTFPFFTPFNELRFGYNFSTNQKPALSQKLDNLANFNTMVKVENNEITVKYLHLDSYTKQMHFAFSWESMYGKEKKRYTICYRVYYDNSVQKIK